MCWERYFLYTLQLVQKYVIYILTHWLALSQGENPEDSARILVLRRNADIWVNYLFPRDTGDLCRTPIRFSSSCINYKCLWRFLFTLLFCCSKGRLKTVWHLVTAKTWNKANTWIQKVFFPIFCEKKHFHFDRLIFMNATI